MIDHPFTTAAFFVLRTPCLPFAFLGDGLEAGSLRSRLREAVTRPAIREALFLASPDLEATLEPWLQGSLAVDKAGRVERSLVRYLTRMSSRSTPFGLFAGCSLGTWGETSRLAVPALASCRRHTRLDMDYLEALVEALERDPGVRGALAYRPNTSLHLAAGRWHYVQPRLGPDKAREHHLVALEATPHLEATLACAASGSGLGPLATMLCAREEVDLQEADAFLEELVEGSILTSDLHPPLTGEEPLPVLARRLGPGPRGEALRKVQEALARLDERGLGNTPGQYRDLQHGLEALPAPINPTHLFQVDLYKPSADLTLGPGVRQALEEAVELLRIVSRPRPPGPLARFREAFRERYDTRSVPLLEALDPETGLNFDSPDPVGSPLLEGLALALREEQGTQAFTARDSYLLKRLHTLGAGRELALDAGDLAALGDPEAPPFPDGFSALATLAAASPQALAEGRFQVLMEHYSGPSGAQLLGRFCHGDPALEARVRAHLAREEALNPGVVFAEIVHQPEGRIGNILSRPDLREYEIPFLGISGVGEEHQILPQDLRVALEGDRFVLRSARLGREVAPRLSSAQNYATGLPVFRFLAQLQDQDAGAGGWTWGPLAALPFLPRVTRGRNVLARARWRVEAEALKPVLAGGEEGAFAAMRALRAARGWPRHVVLEDADNTLWVDLDEPLRVATLLHLVRTRPSFNLLEAFPGPEELAAAGPEGLFCHELVVPFQRKTPRPTRRQAPAGPEGQDRDRVFPPGSEWLYLKLYAGPAAADRILPDVLETLRAVTVEAWDRWFFIRYSDPSPHLRLRFRGDPAQLTGTLLPLLHRILAPHFKSGTCWKLQVDTYERELERYGGPQGMPLAEAWFEQDSESALELLRACGGDEGAGLRWRHALQGADGILAGLGLDVEASLGVVDSIRKGLGREFEAEGKLRIQLGERFRAQRRDLEAWLPGRGLDPVEGHPLAPRQKTALDKLREASLEGKLTVPLEDLAASLVHMHVNRALRAGHRAHELVLADFLGRIYRSWRKR